MVTPIVPNPVSCLQDVCKCLNLGDELLNDILLDFGNLSGSLTANLDVFSKFQLDAQLSGIDLDLFGQVNDAINTCIPFQAISCVDSAAFTSLLNNRLKAKVVAGISLNPQAGAQLGVQIGRANDLVNSIRSFLNNCGFANPEQALKDLKKQMTPTSAKPVTNLVVTPGDGVLTANWVITNSPPILHRVKINGRLVNVTPNNTAVIPNLPNGVAVQVAIQSIRDIDGKVASVDTVVQATPFPTSPVADPTGVVFVEGDGEVKFTFTPSVTPSVVGYVIESNIGTVSLGNVSTFVWKGLQNGTPLAITLRAITDVAVSPGVGLIINPSKLLVKDFTLAPDPCPVATMLTAIIQVSKPATMDVLPAAQFTVLGGVIRQPTAITRLAPDKFSITYTPVLGDGPTPTAKLNVKVFGILGDFVDAEKDFGIS